MASQPPASAAATVSTPSAQVVGNAFVHQYYHILHETPALVYRFYQESSKLGRPDHLGSMDNVTTMPAINEKIMSMDYREVRAEIKTVDAQESLDGGVLVLVTGYLTGKDNVRRTFTQSFFLATQDKGYFVLNDIFRYVEDGDSRLQANVAAVATSSSEQEVPLVREEPSAGRSVPPPEKEEEEEEEQNEEEVYNPSDHEEGSVVEEDIPVEEVIDEVSSNSRLPVVDSSSVITTKNNNSQEEAPKKSYASIVKVKKENAAALSAPAPAPSRPTPANLERQAAVVPPPASAPEVPIVTSVAAETSSVQEAEADGHSIYIKSLPLNATPAQLEEEFKRFGPIKPGGIQVRSHKQQGFCFGFVEFEVASAVQSAIEASPVTISGRQVYVEEKRPAGSRVSNRGRFLPGRGGAFRIDGMRGRGNYGGGWGYGRGDYGIRADFGGRGGGRGGAPNRGGDGSYQRVDSMGSIVALGNRSGSLAPDDSPKSVSPRVPAPA